jgi:hypothetical protein
MDIVGDPKNRERKEEDKLYAAHLYTFDEKSGSWKFTVISGNEYVPASQIDYVYYNIGPTTIQSLYNK